MQMLREKVIEGVLFCFYFLILLFYFTEVKDSLISTLEELTDIFNKSADMINFHKLFFKAANYTLHIFISKNSVKLFLQY